MRLGARGEILESATEWNSRWMYSRTQYGHTKTFLRPRSWYQCTANNLSGAFTAWLMLMYPCFVFLQFTRICKHSRVQEDCFKLKWFCIIFSFQIQRSNHIPLDPKIFWAFAEHHVYLPVGYICKPCQVVWNINHFFRSLRGLTKHNFTCHCVFACSFASVPTKIEMTFLQKWSVGALHVSQVRLAALTFLVDMVHRKKTKFVGEVLNRLLDMSLNDLMPAVRYHIAKQLSLKAPLCAVIGLVLNQLSESTHR